MKKINKILNKWQVCFSIGQNPCMLKEHGWHFVRCGIYKFIKWPEPECEMVKKIHYKGFIWGFHFWFPIDK